jgi:hypothetical protein
MPGTGYAILHEFSAFERVDRRVTLLGFGIAPAFNPISRVFELNVPTLVETLPEQNPLA